MPNIRPSADIRNNYPEISRLCKETGEPVYITVNGKGDAALIDIAVLDEMDARIELYEKIAAGIRDVNERKTYSHEDVFGELRKGLERDV